MKTTDKDLSYYRSLPYTRRVRLERDKGGDYFVACVSELPGLESDGLTELEARFNLQAAFDDYVEALLEQGVTIAEPTYWPQSVAKQGLRRLQFAAALRRFFRRRVPAEDGGVVSFDQHVTQAASSEWSEVEAKAETSGMVARV